MQNIEAYFSDESGTCTNVLASNISAGTFDTIYVTADLSSCFGRIDLELRFNGFSLLSSSVHVATIFTLSASNSESNVAVSTGTHDITLSGSGFLDEIGSNENVYNVTITDSNSCSCKTNSVGRNDEYTLIANITFGTCSGVFFATVMYDGKELSNRPVGTIIELTNTQYDHFFSSQETNNNVTISGIGFSSSYASSYTYTFESDGVMDWNSDTYGNCSKSGEEIRVISFSTIVLTNVSFEECAGSVKVFLAYNGYSYEAQTSTYSGTVISVLDSGNHQSFEVPETNDVTIYGGYFHSTDDNDYSVAMYCDTVESVWSETSTSIDLGSAALNRETKYSLVLSNLDMSSCASGGIVRVDLNYSYGTSNLVSITSVATSSIMTLFDTSETMLLLASENGTITMNGIGFTASDISSYTFNFAADFCDAIVESGPSYTASSITCYTQNQEFESDGNSATSPYNCDLILTNVNVSDCVGYVIFIISPSSLS